MNFSELAQLTFRTVLKKSVGIRYGVARVTYNRSNQREHLEKLRGAWRGQPALIVANGPSLNSTPLDKFIGVPSIGMNKIDLIYPRVKWRPNFVLCVNNLVAAQNQQAWADADIPIISSWKCRRRIQPHLRNRFSYFLSFASRDFSTDAAMGVGTAGTVTYTALQFAYFTGANPIIIVGVDHSFADAKTGKENVIEKREGPDVNHFDPNYFADGQYWGIPNLVLSEYAYGLARKSFEAEGRRIYDATIGGKLTVFDKIEMRDAIQLVQRK